MSTPGPIRVAVVDVSAPLRDVDCTREAAPPYGVPGSSPVDADARWAASSWRWTARGSRPRCSSASCGRSSATPGRGSRLTTRPRWRRPASLSRPRSRDRISCVAASHGLNELDHPDYEVIVVDNRPHGRSGGDPGVLAWCASPDRGSRPLATADSPPPMGKSSRSPTTTSRSTAVWLRALGERFSRQPDLAAVTGLVRPDRARDARADLLRAVRQRS